MTNKDFLKLPYESRKQIVADWVVSTYDETKVRKIAAMFLKMGYDRESFLFGQQEMAYLKAEHNAQQVQTHNIVLAQKE